MPNPQQTCGNCRFLDDNYKDGEPRCHRYPPQAKDETFTSESETGMIPSLPYTANLWRYPEVDKSSWCSEWKPILTSGNISAYDEE